MSETLFGTDGYRGPVSNSAGTGINPGTFERLAYEYVRLIIEQNDESPIIIVGGDTRESGIALREAVTNGAAIAGAEVWCLGEAPTPVIARAAQEHWTHAIAVTASHNPGTDNGFKPFDIGGIKLKDGTLREIEKRYFSGNNQNSIRSHGRYIRKARPELKDEYIKDVVAKIGDNQTLADHIVVIDGANGAVFDMAPRLYQALGATVVKFECNNDGKRINLNCGAAHLDGVRDFVKDNPDLSNQPNFLGVFASDGDGDRVMGVDRLGRVIDGNYWMRRLAIGQLGIVGTVYTNSALREAVERDGVEFFYCPNGDSHVTAKLLELSDQRGPGYTRGGEFTGHLIDLDHLSNGDGLYMGAWMAAQAVAEHITLADIHDELVLWPEKMVNIHVNRAKERLENPSVKEAIQVEQEYLRTCGRLIVRASGTEPVVRIWAESRDEDVDAITGRITQILQAA
jgi:phosphoglucosamine mutase